MIINNPFPALSPGDDSLYNDLLVQREQEQEFADIIAKFSPHSSSSRGGAASGYGGTTSGYGGGPGSVGGVTSGLPSAEFESAVERDDIGLKFSSYAAA